MKNLRLYVKNIDLCEMKYKKEIMMDYFSLKRVEVLIEIFISLSYIRIRTKNRLVNYWIHKKYNVAVIDQNFYC